MTVVTHRTTFRLHAALAAEPRSPRQTCRREPRAGGVGRPRRGHTLPEPSSRRSEASAFAVARLNGPPEPVSSCEVPRRPDGRRGGATSHERRPRRTAPHPRRGADRCNRARWLPPTPQVVDTTCASTPVPLRTGAVLARATRAGRGRGCRRLPSRCRRTRHTGKGRPHQPPNVPTCKVAHKPGTDNVHRPRVQAAIAERAGARLNDRRCTSDWPREQSPRRVRPRSAEARSP